MLMYLWSEKILIDQVSQVLNGGITTSNKQDIIDNVKSVNMQITKKLVVILKL